METTLTVGAGLFFLLAGPFVTYALLSLYARAGRRERTDRESTVPASATQHYPSRTVPGGRERDGR